MIKFKLNKKNINLRNLPLDITINDAIKVASIDSNISEEDMKSIINLSLNNIDTITDEQKDYIVNVLFILSNAKHSDIKNVQLKDLIVLFEYVQPLIDIIYFQNFERYTPYGVSEIKFNKTIYTLPEALTINEDNIQAFREPSKNITESANLVSQISNLKANGIKYLPFLCAIYLQPKGDRIYDEVEIAKRADAFKELPFGIALDVFFFIYYYLINYTILIRLSLLKESLVKRLKRKVLKLMTTIFGYMKWQNRE